MIRCRLCDQEITFDDEYASRKTGKKIPLDPETGEPHDCVQWRLQHRKYYPCKKLCGRDIYFDRENPSGISDSGKWVPLDAETQEPHQCDNDKERDAYN